MWCAIRRIRQVLAQGVQTVLWLGYVLAIAPWAHRISRPVHALRRLQIRRRRNMRLERRMHMLRSRFACQPLEQEPSRVSLAKLSPELNEICGPLRRSREEIPLADIDQDGFLLPRYDRLWDAPRVSADAFVPRARFKLTVVDHDGWVGVRKNFRGDRIAFVNELEAALDLKAAGCHIPAVLGVDFERPSITFAYLQGVVVREELARAGARLRDGELKPVRFSIEERIRDYTLNKKREMSGSRLIGRVLAQETIAQVGETLLAIHRANYTLEDIKYGNVIIEATTKVPYFVDCERALPLREFPHATATYLRDRDAAKLNRLFGTQLLTATTLRQLRRTMDGAVYAPFYAGAGIRWGAIWHPDVGVQRWRHMLAHHVPVPRGGRVLDLGANNGFNALQMLRAGAAEVVGVEIDPVAIDEGLFVKRIYEWSDNVEYRFSYVRGSHADIASMNLGRFDLITAFCTLYYLSNEAMAQTVSDMARMTDTLVLQCNDETWIERSNSETFTKASLPFNVDLVRTNGFPHVTVVERGGSSRPLVIARTRAEVNERVFEKLRGRPGYVTPGRQERWIFSRKRSDMRPGVQTE